MRNVLLLAHFFHFHSILEIHQLTVLKLDTFYSLMRCPTALLLPLPDLECQRQAHYQDIKRKRFRDALWGGGPANRAEAAQNSRPRNQWSGMPDDSRKRVAKSQQRASPCRLFAAEAGEAVAAARGKAGIDHTVAIQRQVVARLQIPCGVGNESVSMITGVLQIGDLRRLDGGQALRVSNCSVVRLLPIDRGVARRLRHSSGIARTLSVVSARARVLQEKYLPTASRIVASITIHGLSPKYD